MTTSRPVVPAFGVGQTDGVHAYLEQAVPALCLDLGIPSSEADQILSLALRSMRACITVMQNSLCAGMVEALPNARALWNRLADVFVSAESTLQGAANLQIVLDHLAHGGNVVVVQNHRSGADTMVFETMLKRQLGWGVAEDWAYMSGHAVNLYLIPLMFTAAMRRFQIFSVKYQSSGLPGIATQEEMDRQNVRALRELGRFVQAGGKVVTVYPEGGRGDFSMKRGEAKTMCIPTLIGKADPPLMIVPTYVHGASNILPPKRGPNEYNEVFLHAQCGTASLVIGRPVLWKDLQPNGQEIEQLAREIGGEPRLALQNANQRLLCDIILSLVAALAPNEKEMGPYADPAFRDRVRSFVEKR